MPALNILHDSREGTTEEREIMSRKIETHLPAPLRKYATSKMECETDGQYELMNACKALNMGKSNNSTTVRLPNDALGALLDICREWRDDDNFSRSQAAKTVLKRHELDYEPEDPRQRRHEFKMPKSLGSYVSSQITQGFLKGRPELLAELKACANGDGSFSGRVTYGTLGWLLEVARSNSVHGAGAPQRAGKRFLESYTEAYEQTECLIDGSLGASDDDQASAGEETPPTLEWEWLTGLDHGQRVWCGGSSMLRSATPQLATVRLEGANLLRMIGDDGAELLSDSPYAKGWWAPAEGASQEDQEPEELAAEETHSAAEARAWEKAKLSSYVRWSEEPSYFWFGGVVKDGEPDPVGTLVSVSWHESKRGQNFLRDVDTNEVVATVHSMSQVWATGVDLPALVGEDKAPAEVIEHQDQEPAAELGDQEPAAEAAPEQAGKSVGPVPENWVAMVEEACTETARAWWRRKVARWGR
ncbi:hypothetical protein [Kitasatospora sp. NPDC096204]|uniref:hypothetical protein n=1 Tax=Kitasatospora sp. NPDC096204 TaxID=3364094 RepID=UPI00381810F5